MELTNEQINELCIDLDGTNSVGHSGYLLQHWKPILGEDTTWSDLVAIVETNSELIDCDYCGWVSERGFHVNACGNICVECVNDQEYDEND